MAQSLIDALACSRDLVSIVGAGGKTTLALSLAAEAANRGRRYIVTTTTRMGTNQAGSLTAVPPDEIAVADAIGAHGGCLVIGGESGGKRRGVKPEWVDHIWREGLADMIVVEADGARRREVKAPAMHEPVIPSASSLVVTMIAATALGRPIAEVAHRPTLVGEVVGALPEDVLSVTRAAKLLISPRGGGKGIPRGARRLVAITRASEVGDETVAELMDALLPVRSVLVQPSGAPLA